jgi:hypothetical protein
VAAVRVSAASDPGPGRTTTGIGWRGPHLCYGIGWGFGHDCLPQAVQDLVVRVWNHIACRVWGHVEFEGVCGMCCHLFDWRRRVDFEIRARMTMLERRDG